MFATAFPNWSPSDSVGPFVVLSLILTKDFTAPLVFMYKTYAAPLSFAPSPGAPTTRSVIPSPLRSPMLVIDEPNASPFANVGEFSTLSFISTVDFTDPTVLLRNMM